jgi:hypothetical protein
MSLNTPAFPLKSKIAVPKLQFWNCLACLYYSAKIIKTCLSVKSFLELFINLFPGAEKVFCPSLINTRKGNWQMRPEWEREAMSTCRGGEAGAA